MEVNTGFENLKVWRYSKDLAVCIYKLTSSNKFPIDEKFGLVSQMRRASVSIASNIAEGTGRLTPNDKIRFVTIAFGSAIELLNQIIISAELGYVAEKDYYELRNKIRLICAMLSGLKKSIK